MRIGFFAPGDYQDTNIRVTGPCQGLAYIASYLKEQVGVEDIFLEVDPQRIIEKKPDLVGISAFSVNYGGAVSGAREIKKKLDIPIVIGGPHISALPMNLDPSMDIGVMGEGEIRRNCGCAPEKKK